MFIRTPGDANQLINWKRYTEYLTKTNTYIGAFPFDRCGVDGGTSAIAFTAIHGRNAAVTSLADIWGQGGIRTMPTAGFTIGVSSSDAADVNTSGTGAWKVEVDLLDTDYALHTITLNLNGQSKVSDTNYVTTAFRINDVRVSAVGTGLTNAGDIYVYDASSAVVAGVPSDGTKIFHKILAGENVGRGAFYTVPAGCKLQTQQFRGGFDDATATARSGNMQVVATQLMGGKLVTTAFPISGQVAQDTGAVRIMPDFPLVFPEKTDIMIQAAASASAIIAVYLDAILFYA